MHLNPEQIEFAHKKDLFFLLYAYLLLSKQVK